MHRAIPALLDQWKLVACALAILLAMARPGIAPSDGKETEPDRDAKSGAELTPPERDSLPPEAIARLGSTRLRHGGGINGLFWSPDGKWLASAGGQIDRAIRFWHPDTGREIRRFEGHTADVNTLAVSPDGKRIASGDANNTIIIWGSTVKVPPARSQTLAWSPDGKRLAFGPVGQGRVCLFDPVTGKIERHFGDEFVQVLRLAFSADGKMLASAESTAGRQRLRVWDVASGKLQHTLPHDHDEVEALAFAPGNLLLASAGVANNLIYLWDPAKGTRIGQLAGHTGWVSSLAFTPDGKVLASASVDGSVRLWDVGGHKQLLCYTGHKRPLHAVAFSPDGKRVASGGSMLDSRVHIWDARTGKDKFPDDAPSGWIGVLDLLPDGTLVASGSDQTVSLWNLRSGKRLAHFAGHQMRGKSFALSSRANRLATGGADNRIRVFEVPCGIL